MKGKTILHICDYSAPYKGNFISSLESLDGVCVGGGNVYLFPSRVIRTGAITWINELNSTSRGVVAYIQTDSFTANLKLLKDIIQKHKVDFVFKHFYDIKIDIALKFSFPSRKVFRFMHCMYEGASAKGIKHRIRRFFWAGNTLIGVSKAVSDGLYRAFPNFCIKTVENGISFERFKNVYEIKSNDRVPNLLCMGYNVHVKGVDIALSAIRKIRERNSVTLSIVAASHMDELKSFIISIFGNIPDWINILPPTSDIGCYYSRADIFLAPSRTEACPYALIEAAYCKLPLVASRVGGQAKLQINGVYWFENEDVDGLATQINNALSEYKAKEKNVQLERVSREVEERYSIESWCKNALALIGE